jgi:hypothetical protein
VEVAMVERFWNAKGGEVWHVIGIPARQHLS